MYMATDYTQPKRQIIPAWSGYLPRNSSHRHNWHAQLGLRLAVRGTITLQSTHWPHPSSTSANHLVNQHVHCPSDVLTRCGRVASSRETNTLTLHSLCFWLPAPLTDAPSNQLQKIRWVDYHKLCLLCLSVPLPSFLLVKSSRSVALGEFASILCLSCSPSEFLTATKYTILQYSLTLTQTNKTTDYKLIF